MVQQEQYTLDDLIIPILAERGLLSVTAPSGPMCRLTVQVDADRVRLRLGPRDWSWDRKTGKLVGAGTGVCDVAAPLAVVSDPMPPAI